MARELGRHDTISEDLTSQLPVWMPKDPLSGNHRLLNPIADDLETTVSDQEAIKDALNPQTANSIGEIQQIAKLVNLPPEQGESLEHYRARVLARFHMVTSEGTVPDLLIAIGTILDLDIERLTYTEEHTTENGSCQVGVPGKALDNLALSAGSFASIADGLIAGEYRIDVLARGTYTYLSTSDYTGTGSYSAADLNSDSTIGHDGLDTNDDPKDNGGTYAGVLQ